MRGHVAAILIGCWLWYAPAYAESPVKIVNRHRAGLPPFYLVFKVQIEKHELNRQLCISWGNKGWDKNLWERSCRQLDGIDTKRTFDYPVSPRRVIRETGEFVIEAEVIRSDKTYRDRTSVIVGTVPTMDGEFNVGP